MKMYGFIIITISTFLIICISGCVQPYNGIGIKIVNGATPTACLACE